LHNHCIIMSNNKNLFDKIINGRTDLIFKYLGEGHPPTSKDNRGVSLMQWCAYYGDVSGIKYLIENGESLQSLGENFDLNGAAFHGYWRLCEYLIEKGADVNYPLADIGETPLHAALSKATRPEYLQLVSVLLRHGADPNSKTKEDIETGAFMRDCRTKGETPLHRAAAFASEEVIQLLLDAGASRDIKDMHGDSPLTWASWYLRPRPILRKLCYGTYHIRPESP
jgi:ankyrin repeat protein